MFIPIMPYLMDDGLNTVDIKTYHLAEIIKNPIQILSQSDIVPSPQKNRHPNHTTVHPIQNRFFFDCSERLMNLSIRFGFCQLLGTGAVKIGHPTVNGRPPG